MFGRIHAGVAKDRSALLHPLLKLDRKTEQCRVGQLKSAKAAMRERNVERALRLAAIPALAGSDLMQQLTDQSAGFCRACEAQEEIARDRHVVAAQNESLDVCLVQLTHCGRLS